PGLHRPEGRFHTIHMGGERAWQKMSRAFFTPFGKTCHVLLPMISAKDGAFILRQNVTILNKQYLLSFPLTLQQREEVLTIRMFRFASEQRDEVARTGIGEGEAGMRVCDRQSGGTLPGRR